MQWKINELKAERDEALKLVSTLKEELKLQEDHFNKISGTQADYYSKLVEKSLADERKVSELMAKLNAEQFEFNRYKQEHGRLTKGAEDVSTE